MGELNSAPEPEVPSELEQARESTSFSPDELRSYWEHFQRAYPGGRLTRTEFIRENVRLRGGRDSVWSRVYDSIDIDGDGSIDFKEYMIFLSTLDPRKSSTEILETTFELVDADGNGFLDEDELTTIVKVIAKEQALKRRENFERAEPLDVSAYTKELFSIMDIDGDGVISKEEFMQTCLKNPEIRENLTTPLHQANVLYENHSSDALNVKTFEAQVGGHGSSHMKDLKNTIIQQGDKLLKPLFEPEFEFYERIENSTHPVDLQFKKYFPKYYGRQYIEYPPEPKSRGAGAGVPQTVHYIIMENLANGMGKPCAMDTKMGTRGYSQDANAKKRLQQRVLCQISTSARLGFRVCGMKVYKRNIEQFFSINKYRGARLRNGQLEDMFVNYINNGRTIRVGLLRVALVQLREILQLFEEQTRYNFFSSSLLFLYDGESDDDNSMKVNMVDFAHIDETGQRDEGYLKGIRVLIARFEAIIAKHSS